jgi:hypothetical protein
MHVNIKLDKRGGRVQLKNTTKKDTKRNAITVKLKPDGTYVRETIVTEAAASNSKPQVMVSLISTFTIFNKVVKH